MFACSLSKEAWVSDLVISNSEGSRSWNFLFRHGPQDWEADTVYSFFELIYSSMPRGEGDDHLVWRLTTFGVFDVRSFYKLLSSPSPNIDEFPWEGIWCAKVPKRVSFFLWTIANDGILTIDNLVKRGRFLVNRCCLCYCDEESVDHLLLHYKFSQALWCEAFVVFGIQWVMPRSVSSFFFTWRNWFGKHRSTIWNMVPACLMWLVWQERNTRTLEDKERTLDHLKSLLFGTLFFWAHIWGCMKCISLSDFFSLYFLWFLIILYLFLVQSVHHHEHDVKFFQ